MCPPGTPASNCATTKYFLNTCVLDQTCTHTSSECPLRTAISWPVWRSHTRTVLSREAVTMTLASNRTHLTPMVCPCRVNSSAWVFLSHTWNCTVREKLSLPLYSELLSFSLAATVDRHEVVKMEIRAHMKYASPVVQAHGSLFITIKVQWAAHPKNTHTPFLTVFRY